MWEGESIIRGRVSFSNPSLRFSYAITPSQVNITQSTILWLIAVFALGIDTGLTILGLQVGLVELNPIVEGMIKLLGPFGLIILKLIALITGGFSWVLVPIGFRLFIPVLLSIPWLIASFLNIGILLGV